MAQPQTPTIPEGTTRGSEEFHEALSKDAVLAWEWFRYYERNPKYFLKDCVKIIDKEGQLVPLDIDDPRYKRPQNYFFNIYMRNYFSTGRFRAVVLKARQWGCTTLTKGMELHAMLFSPYHRGLSVADDNDGAEGILEILRDMYDNLPDWIRPATKFDRTTRIRFQGWLEESPLHRTPDDRPHENKSWMRVETAANAKAGRKWSIRSFSGSEVAFWPAHAAKVLGGISQALAKTAGSLGVLESTGNGWGGEFYERCERARIGKSPWEFVFIPWFWIGEYHLTSKSKMELDYLKVNFKEFCDHIKAGRYDEASLSRRELAFAKEHGCTGAQILWYRYTLEDSCNGDDILMAQEYPAVPSDAFIVEGDAAFSVTALMKQMEEACLGEQYDLRYSEAVVREFLYHRDVRAFDLSEDHQGRIHVWKEPVEGHEYIVAVDPSEGAESYVDEKKEGDNTAIIVGDRTTGEVVARVAGSIVPDQTALLAMGLAYWYNEAVLAPENNAGFGTSIIELAKDYGYANTFLQRVTDDSRKNTTYKMGWNTGEKSRHEMFSTARAAVRRGVWKIWDTMLLRELLSMVFKHKPGGKVKVEPTGGSKDDVCLAFVIMARVNHLLGEMEREEAPKDKRKKLDPKNILYGEWQRLRDLEDKPQQYSAW